jgi:hypothetical protein
MRRKYRSKSSPPHTDAKGEKHMNLFLGNEKGDIIELGSLGWAKALSLAEAHGWQPRATQAPADRDDDNSKALDQILWDGRNYFSNEAQVVTREDAKQIADALEESLQNIPEEITDSLVFEVLKKAWLENGGIELKPMSSRLGLGLLLYVPPDRMSPNVFFSAGAKNEIRELIQLCRAGSFRITRC